MIDEAQLLKEVRAGVSDDGQYAQLEFKRNNGVSAYVQFRADMTGSVMLSIEQNLATVFEKQRAMLQGKDPRSFFSVGAKQVSKVQGGVTDGVPVISPVLTTGLRLDFSLEQIQVRELIEWLEQLEELPGLPRSAPN